MFQGTTKFLRRNAIACLALFVALGGSSYAAISLPSNSIGAKQIKKGGVRTGEVKNRTLRLVDLRPSAREALAGQDGAPGAPGISGLVRVEGSLDDGSGDHSSQAFCPEGKSAISGGYSTAGIDDGELSISTATITQDGKSFLVQGRRAGAQGDWNLTSSVWCANVAS
jgi:hypothetical protein